MFNVFWSIAGLLLSLCATVAASGSASASSSANLTQPPDAAALLAFKSKADLKNTLPFSQNASPHLCQWQGVKCSHQKVVRLVLQDLHLGGVFAPNTLTRLDQLRVLGLQNTSLAGPIPDLSKLINLKTLFLDHNSFTDTFPLSVFSLHRVRILDLSYNNLTGPIPTRLASVDRLYYLNLQHNRFNGSVPPFNQSSLLRFNVSFNNLTGAIPVTATLHRFGLSAFSSNPSLCGEIVHKECRPSSAFFGPSAPAPTLAPPPAVSLGPNEELHGVDFAQRSAKAKHKRTSVIIGFSSAAFVLVGSLFCFVMAVKKKKEEKEKEKEREKEQEKKNEKESKSKSKAGIAESDGAGTMAAAAVMQIDQQENELEEKVKRMQGMQVGKSGNLMFCAGEAQLYTLDQLMRASAELLGRGSTGTTYKAVLDSRLIVCVKRLDAGKLAGTSRDDFEQHMESVGGLRHPNLVPLRAYFQANEERLLIYDYQPNGSLLSLIHGSKSTRAKPLHWTSCLKIAEDVAQGLSYIHQAWRLVHGNLKSSNVLLGPDFEACVSDYCLAALVNADSLSEDDPDNAAYRAPELRNSSDQASPKSDVFSFGILLLELLTGRLPSQLPVLVPNDLVDWVGSARDGDGGEDNRLGMLLEVAVACSLTSPEQRPTMWQVLKMLQEIKETVSVEEGELDPNIGLS